MAWELIFMLLLLKIPLFYLCGVVWWAIKAEPTCDDLPGDPTLVREPLLPDPSAHDAWSTGKGRSSRRLPLRRPARRTPASSRRSPARTDARR